MGYRTEQKAATAPSLVDTDRNPQVSTVVRSTKLADMIRGISDSRQLLTSDIPIKASQES